MRATFAVALVAATVWATACASSGVRPAARPDAREATRRAALLRDPSNAEWRTPAPELSRLRVETTKGVFVLELVRAWGPIGADRLYNLARLGYYDDTRVHRVNRNYIAQFGLHGDSAVNAAWKDRYLPDDPPRSHNVRGTFAFSFKAMPNTRNTQIYINLADNTKNDAEAFTVLGTVVEGMSVVDSLYAGYGESSGSGVRQGKQGPLANGGNAFMDREYPRLDRIRRITVETVPSVASPAGIDLSRYTMIDLTHEIAADMPAWPGSRNPFKLDTITATATGAMFRLTINEHLGTHLDAPRHASGTGATNERIPLDRLIAPLVVIDVQRQAAANRDYALTVDDIAAHERAFGRIAPGSIVLLRTGWAKYWQDPSRYFGADSSGGKTVLHFPSYGADAARLLATARGVAMLGVDAASTDIGAAPAFLVHGILGAANVSGLENLAALDALPRTGALLMALPIKTKGGSGGPVRVVALVPR